MTPYEALVAKLGEAGAKEEMRRRAALSSRNSKGTGGFAYIKKHDPERLKTISLKGLEARRKNESDSL